jgi:hypothetical protein
MWYVSVGVHAKFWWRNVRYRGHLEDLGLNGKIRLKETFKTWDRGIGWIDVAEGRDRWTIVVKAALKLRVLQNAGNLTS